MSTIARSIDVDVPVTRAFEAWSHFENLPQFLEGVERADRLDQGRYQLTGDLGSGRQVWEVRVLEAIPDLLLSWESSARRPGMRTLTFSTDEGVTRLSMVVEYEPEDVAPLGADAHEVMTHRLDQELRRFKSFIETQEARASKWRMEGEPAHT